MCAVYSHATVNAKEIFIMLSNLLKSELRFAAQFEYPHCTSTWETTDESRRASIQPWGTVFHQGQGGAGYRRLARHRLDDRARLCGSRREGLHLFAQARSL